MIIVKIAQTCLKFTMTRVSHFITELNIHHRYSHITLTMILDSADPISTVKACHISRSSVDRVPIGVRELMSSVIFNHF